MSGYRPVRLKLVPKCDELRFRKMALLSHEVTDTILYPLVGYWPDIGFGKGKNAEHIGGPRAKALDARDFLANYIFRCGEPIVRMNNLLLYFAGKIEDIARFLSGDSDFPEFLTRKLEDRFWRDGLDFSLKSVVNRRCGFG